MASLCSVIASISGAATPPSGGGPGDVSQANSTLWQVTAQLMGAPVAANDGIGLVDQVILATVTDTGVVISGYLTGYRDLASYTLKVPFIDQLFVGSVAQVPPYSLYYLVTERYITNSGFGSLLSYGQPGATGPFATTRKIRPLSAGGPTQAIDSILI